MWNKYLFRTSISYDPVLNSKEIILLALFKTAELCDEIMAILLSTNLNTRIKWN